MPVLLPPPPGHRFRIEDVSKDKLAAMVNSQSEELQALLAQKHDLMAIILAMVSSQDAVQWVDGVASFDASRLGEVAAGTTLKAQREGDRVVLRIRHSTYVLHADPFRMSMMPQ
jgi:hypothetical protein